MNLYDWAKTWNISAMAINDLKNRMGLRGTIPQLPHEITTEAQVKKVVRLEGAQKGITLWSNNVGVAVDEQGRYIRYGLANDSKAMNMNVKSSDLIGIGPDGLFYARETKRPGWHYTGTPREVAQLKFLQLVLSKGGNAEFATGKGTL